MSNFRPNLELSFAGLLAPPPRRPPANRRAVPLHARPALLRHPQRPQRGLGPGDRQHHVDGPRRANLKFPHVHFLFFKTRTFKFCLPPVIWHAWQIAAAFFFCPLPLFPPPRKFVNGPFFPFLALVVPFLFPKSLLLPLFPQFSTFSLSKFPYLLRWHTFPGGGFSLRGGRLGNPRFT